MTQVQKTEAELAYEKYIESISTKWAKGETLTAEETDAGTKYLLAKWEESKLALEAAKADEMIWRKRVVDFAFDPTKKAGTERIDLENGYQAKAVKKINYGWIKTDDGKLNKAAIETALCKIEESGPAGALIADRLVKWTPELSLTEYKVLPAEFKAIIDPVIVTTDGAPTLEIIAPKSKA